MTIDTEIARRNYAIEALTFDADHYLQIRCGEEVFVTVRGTGDENNPEFFAVFNGDGMDEEDNELPNEKAAKLFAARGDRNRAWRLAARFGYLQALSKMMLADEREEQASYSLELED